MSKMTGEILLVGIAITLILVALQFWRIAYENGRLKELVKQKDAEIEQLKINRDIHMRDRD